METIDSLFIEILGWAICGILAYLLTKFGLWRWLLEFLSAPSPAKSKVSGLGPLSQAVAHPPFLEDLDSPSKRAIWLQDSGCKEALDDLGFLQPGDHINGLELKKRIGGGRTTVVWEASSEKYFGTVAVKFLRQSLVCEPSLVSQFQFAARSVFHVRSESVVGVLSSAEPWPDPSPPSGRGSRRLAAQSHAGTVPLTYYYVLNLCKGELLQDFAQAYPERHAEVVGAIAKLACELHEAHEQGVVFRDLTPADFIVDPALLAARNSNRSAIKLIDFDSVTTACSSAVHRLPATLGFSAPEVFETPQDVDRTADVFSLARIIAFVYNGGPLPNTYGSSSAEVIRLLNCPPKIKKLLASASSPLRSERPKTLLAFSEALEGALKSGEQPLAFETIPHERRKIYLILAHACFGTFVMMMMARPLLSWWPGVQLSDTRWVAAFQGVIGALMWGTFIPAAFVLYLILIRNRYGSHPGLAALCCAMGGFFAGVVCALPSVLVTNAGTLRCLGWITSAAVDSEGMALASARVLISVTQTRMALSFPLTGILTGCGVGLCLSRGIEIAIRESSGGSGVLPVPTKDESIPLGALRESLKQVLVTWKSHVFLAIPFVFAFLVALILDPAHDPSLSCHGLIPQPWTRSFGEGAVHYLGSLGLVTGFFYAIPLIKPTWR